jgi:hypothetical protein
MTYEEIVSALRLLSNEQRLMLIEEIAHSLLIELRAGQGYLSDAPVTRGLIGILSPETSVEDYWRYIDEKYGEGLATSEDSVAHNPQIDMNDRSQIPRDQE